MRNRAVVRFTALILVLSSLFSLVSCSSFDGDSKTTETTIAEILGVDANGNESPYADDALEMISVDEISVNTINVVSIDPNEIVCNSINVNEIESIELQVVPLNDEIITLAYENFVSVYGDNIDYRALFTDIAAGAVVIVVWVTLSTAVGPVGTYFGAVITSEFAAKALVIGAAIDAAVSGYQAYAEGGDIEYILGNMVNGVADGFMWTAILAPVFGVVNGIQALRAVNKLRKLPGFEEYTETQLRKVFTELADILRKTKDIDKNAKDKVIRDLYQQIQNELSQEITEDLFLQIVRNRSAITYLARTLSPFGVGSEVLVALKENLMDRLPSEVSVDVFQEFIRQMRSGSISSFDDIAVDELKTFIRENSTEFLDLYRRDLTNSFVDNWLKEFVSQDEFELIRDNITNISNLRNIVSEFGIRGLSDLVNNPDAFMLMCIRFGSENATNLKSISILCNLLKNASNSSSIDSEVLTFITQLLSNQATLSSIKNQTMLDSLIRNRNAIASVIHQLGLSRGNAELLDELAIDSLRRIDGITAEIAEDIVGNRLSREAIVETYGPEVFDSLVSSGNDVLNVLSYQAVTNESLAREIATEALSSLSLSDEMIEGILRFESTGVLEMTDAQIDKVGGIVSEYYRAVNPDAYHNFIMEYADARGANINEFLNTYLENNTIINYAERGGVMTPTGSNANDIRERYGEIYMSQYGFPVFDEYAIARIELPDLTGYEEIDVVVANRAHHGTRSSIPGYTWHHLEDGRTLILIPTDLHEAYRHTGGASLIREGL